MQRIRRSACVLIVVALTSFAGCDALYNTTETPIISATGATTSVAVAVTPKSTVTSTLTGLNALAPVAGIYAPVVSGAVMALTALLGLGGTIWQWWKQRSANAQLAAVVHGVEAYSNTPTPTPAQVAAGVISPTVKQVISTMATVSDVAQALDNTVQTLTR